MKNISELKLRLKTPSQKELHRRLAERLQFPEPCLTLARTFQREGDHGQAEKVLRFAVSAFPRNRLVREQLADLYEASGKIPQAVRIYRELIREGQSWAAFTRLARIYRARGEPEAAISLLQSIPAAHPFKERTFPVLFSFFFVINDHRRGIENLQEAIRLCGPCHRYLKDLGRLYLKAGKKKEAVEQIRQSLAYQPDDLDAVKLIGLAYLDLGDYAQARRCFMRILKKDPDSYQAMIQLAELCLLQHRLEEAKRWLDKIRSIQAKKGEPWDSRSKLAMGEYFLKNGDPRKSIAITLEGLKETPFYYRLELLHAYSILEASFRALEDKSKTRLYAAIRKALTDESDVFSALIGLAERLRGKSDLAPAKEVLEHLLFSFPGNILVLVKLAEAQFKRGMVESAVQIAQAASSAPAGSFAQDKARALGLLAGISRKLGDSAAAKEYARQAKEL